MLDEIGKMEMFSTGFVRGVRQAISDPSSTILTTIPIAKGKPIPLVEEIRSSPKFMVVNVRLTTFLWKMKINICLAFQFMIQFYYY